MTGQSVQFEQKFNYRRPMYMVMDYIWNMPEYQRYFKYVFTFKKYPQSLKMRYRRWPLNKGRFSIIAEWCEK